MPRIILILTKTFGIMIQIKCYIQERQKRRIYITVGKTNNSLGMYFFHRPQKLDTIVKTF